MLLQMSICPKIGLQNVSINSEKWAKLGTLNWTPYIIDPTIMTTIRQKKRELFSNNIYEVTHMIFLCKHKHKTMRLENVILEYKPRLVGCEFYEHTQYGIPVFSISSGAPSSNSR